MRLPLFLTLLILSSFCKSLPVSNEVTEWQSLFDGKGLTGWEVVGGGDWKVEDGSIVVRRKEGDSASSWLVTRAEFTNFKLRLSFKTTHEHFNSGVLFRDPGHARVGRPAFNGYELQLYQATNGSERNTTGAIYDLARSYPRKIKPNTWNDIEIHCLGYHIVTFVNGEKTSETHSRRSLNGAIGLQMHGGKNPLEYWWKDIEILIYPQAALTEKLMEEELELHPGEFLNILTDKTLQDDFNVYWDGGADWFLEDGVLRGENPSEIAWIFMQEEFSDFILTFDFRISSGGNGGVCVRFPWPQDGDTSNGPAFLGIEGQITDTGEVNPTGSIYGLARSFETDAWNRPIHKPETWNHYRIYVKGNHIVNYVNRRKTAEAHVDRTSKGWIGFQVHHPAKWIEYRNVLLKECNN